MARKNSAGSASIPELRLNLLLEIGTEEIPARFLLPSMSMLKDNAESILEDYSIEFSEVKTYATPRRLTLVVRGILPLQKERVKEVYGPSKKAAFDDSGVPTKAAGGFARSQGVRVEDLVVKTKDKGEYVVAVIRQEGVAVKDLLPEILKKTVLSLTFPKSMRWGNGSLRFARPIHWIMALFGGETIAFEVDGIRSGNITRGHRFLSPGSFAIKEIASYIHLLENNYVIVDHYERMRKIETGIESLASSVEGRPVKDESLLNTVTFLVEYPVPVLCTFSSDYLVLPKELLVTVMKDHQKYFAIEDGEGRLRNFFIVISNTKDENSETIKTGAERVIKARFEDARFYYEEDIKRPLHSRIEDLKRVTFHDRLGSLYDKVSRIVKLSSSLSQKVCPDKKAVVERAAWLCKTDLLTGVVGEFPELQGLMGKYYALQDGEGRDVAEAIVEHYLPAYSGDRLPGADAGSVLSLSDKVDNIVSFFAVGLTPTGSEDPFALRRQSLAAISILMDKGYDIPLRRLVREAASGLAAGTKDVSQEVLGFFAQRFEQLLLSQNHDMDIVQSVIHFVDGEEDSLSGVKEKILAVKRFKGEDGYNAFLLAIKRINNISSTAADVKIREKLLSGEPEKVLYGNVMNTEPAVSELLGRKHYFDALKTLSALTESINNFFDKVLVMDKNEDVRTNRLALLRRIGSMAYRIADFSKLKENQ
jgi:glycyl-tRNA synthetase beta chain